MRGMARADSAGRTQGLRAFHVHDGNNLAVSHHADMGRFARFFADRTMLFIGYDGLRGSPEISEDEARSIRLGNGFPKPLAGLLIAWNVKLMFLLSAGLMLLVTTVSAVQRPVREIN